MAQSKDSKSTEKMLKCSLCSAEVPASQYTEHVRAEHGRPSEVSQPAQSGGYRSPTDIWDDINGERATPLTGAIKAENYADKYLKGSDVPEDKTTVTFTLLRFLRDTNTRSKLAAEISETYGKTRMGLNTVNIRSLGALGFDDLQKAVGKKITCTITMQPNPQRGNIPTRSLFITSAE